MQIVINIDEDEYNNMKSLPFTTFAEDIIINGMPLPKGHGRLIDAEQLMNYCQNQIDGHKYADCNVIARFPTILDAEVENDD